MNLDEARRKLVYLENKRRLLDSITTDITDFTHRASRDKDIQALFEKADSSYEENNEAIRKLKHAIYQAEKTVEVDEQEEAG